MFPHCNHLQVTLLVNGMKQHPRGPGYWKFNASLLEDKNFVEQTSTKIPGFKNQYQGVVGKGLLWELVKMEIRAYTINFSKQRATQHKNVAAELVKKAQNLKRKLTKKEMRELLAEHNKIIRELESISLQRTCGACLNTERSYIMRLRCSACQSQIPTGDQCSHLIGLFAQV